MDERHQVFRPIYVNHEHILGWHMKHIFDNPAGITRFVNHCQPTQPPVPELIRVIGILVGLNINDENGSAQIFCPMTITHLVKGDNKAAFGPAGPHNRQISLASLNTHGSTYPEPLIWFVSAHLNDNVASQPVGTAHPSDDDLHRCRLFHCDS